MFSYPIWINIAIYQAIWFCGVLGKERLVAVVFLLLAIHVWLVKERYKELLVMILCSAAGIAADSALALSGLFVFSPAPELLPIPLWLVGIWLGFAATFRHAMAYFIARPRLAILLAAIGAPITYLAASRFGAVELPLGHWQTGILLAVLWAMLMGIFVWITQTVATSQMPVLISSDTN